MGIEMVGIDHSVAEIDIRMIFSFTKKSTRELFEEIKNVPGIAGCVLLSTCNRMELWISTEPDWDGDLYGLLCRIRQVPPEIYRSYFTFRRERDAAAHLFRLAAGLESRILGEDQILTQVGEALAFSRENYAADHVLETLFRQAVTAAKKVKTEVELPASDPSAAHTAVRQLQEQGLSFAGKKCLVIGNGVMGKLAATLLKEQGADVTVTVRQYRSGVVEIPRGCSRIDYGKRLELLPDCDFAVSATVSPNYTLPADLVKECIRRPIVLIDLAVPRDIDPAVRELPDVQLYDIDCFREEATSEEQRRAIRQAEALIEKQMKDFFAWYDCVDVMPLIGRIKREIAADLEPRLSKKLRDLPLEEERRRQLRADIEAATIKTMNKMLFGLRDGLEQRAFRDCLDCMDAIYREEQDEKRDSDWKP